jgi:hypothetical protein
MVYIIIIKLKMLLLLYKALIPLGFIANTLA